MHRSLPVSLALLQALSALGADFTAEEIRRKLDGFEALELRIPPDLPPYPRMETRRFTCGKCGGVSTLLEDPALMQALIERLDRQQSNIRFELDTSRLCAHCGDGMIYLKIFGLTVDLKTGKTAWVQRRHIPITTEELLFLLAPRGGGRYCIPPMLRYGDRGFLHEDSFKVRSDAEMRNVLNKIRTPQWSEKQREKLDAGIRSTAAHAEIFQKLTSSAAVLRREDLDSYLAQTRELGERCHSLRISAGQMLSRMLITLDTPDRWFPVECPKCTRRFYILNGSNAPIMQPLGDLLAVMTKFDLTPCYDSLCPSCHPGSGDRKLRVTLRLSGQKELSADLTPLDLAVLAECFTLTERNGSRIPFRLPQRQIMRLREILLGEKNPPKTAALPDRK